MDMKKIQKIKIQDCQGSNVSLDDYLGHYVVLYFYPKDDTPGCTQEGKDFRDQQSAFKKLDAIILGISKDTVECHIKFIEKHGFNFTLLSDIEQKLCHAFDVIKEKNMYGKKYLGIERSTFLISPEGEVLKEWRKVKVPGHVEEILKTLKEINKK